MVVPNKKYVNKKIYSSEYNVKVRPRILLKEEIQVSLITGRTALWGLFIDMFKTNHSNQGKICLLKTDVWVYKAVILIILSYSTSL